jgi:hypothetical protein
VELNIAKAYCTTIISGKGFYISDQEKFEDKSWFEQRHEMLLVPVSTWVEIKKYLIMNCKKSRKCSNNISSWDRGIQNIDEQLVKKAQE